MPKRVEPPLDLEYFIKVDASGNAKVTRNPDVNFAVKRFKKNKGKATFRSDDPKTVIRYGATSAFVPPGPGANAIFAVGKGSQGPFLTVNDGDHHFECGEIVSGKFSPWAVTKGDDTPVDP